MSEMPEIRKLFHDILNNLNVFSSVAYIYICEAEEIEKKKFSGQDEQTQKKNLIERLRDACESLQSESCALEKNVDFLIKYLEKDQEKKIKQSVALLQGVLPLLMDLSKTLSAGSLTDFAHELKQRMNTAYESIHAQADFFMEIKETLKKSGKYPI